MEELIGIILTFILLPISLPLLFYGLLNVYQQSGYRLNETLQALCRIRRTRLILVPILCSIFATVSTILYCLKIPTYPTPIAIFLTSIVVGKQRKKRAIIKIKFTPRMKRFVLTFSTVGTIIGTLISFYAPLSGLSIGVGAIVGILFNHITLTPIEKKHNNKFIKRASNTLANSKCVKVGITGSYGKTTTKEVLKLMLCDKNVLATSGNYNTPLGISKTINENQMDNTEVFIAEMGARHKGDIAELCSIVNPTIGIITAIGSQHLSTFKNRENLLATKGELITSVQKLGGLVVLNGDNEGCKQLYAHCDGNKYLVGRDENAIMLAKQGIFGQSEYDAYYGNVKSTHDGVMFSLVVAQQLVIINTKLTSDYIPSIITLCAQTAILLGSSIEQIKKACQSLKAVAHRQEIVYNGNDVIIDDAYNGSEESIVSALKTLSKFTNKKRVIITPGVVEAGKEQQKINYNLGKEIAKNTDYAIFVGVNATSLRLGAQSCGMLESKIGIVKTLNEATEILKKIEGGKAVLFANDLPDGY